MAADEPTNPLAESGVTMHSDSEQYGEESGSPASTGSPVILYKPPTIWSLLRGAAINLMLPFINGMMLGFGELFAHEAAFRLGWGGTKVRSLGVDIKYEMNEVTNAPQGFPDDEEEDAPDRTWDRGQGT